MSYGFLWGNIPSFYRVSVPEGLVPVYEVVAAVALSLAVITGGYWLVRHRTLHTPKGRVLLWAVGGLASVVYLSHWIRQNDGFVAKICPQADGLTRGIVKYQVKRELGV